MSNLTVSKTEVLQHGQLTLDVVRRHVTRAGKSFTIGISPLSILEVLMRRPHEGFSASQIYHMAGMKLCERNLRSPAKVVSSNVYLLRKKLGEDVISRTVGGGYKLAETIGKSPATAVAAEQEKPLILRHEDILLDWVKLKVTRGERVINLTPREFRVVAELMENPNLKISSRRLYRASNGLYTSTNYDPTNNIRSQMNRIRRKLGLPNVIASSLNEGYILVSSTLTFAEIPVKNGGHRYMLKDCSS